MNKDIFLPADILIPKLAEYENWSVIACDQFSSDKSYWKRVKNKTNNKLSTFHMIVPEAFLDGISMQEEAASKNNIMKSYIENEVFEVLENSFVYVEREVTGGKIRHGLVGVIDLDEYEYSPGNNALIRASENTVVDRLPPRISVRKNAVLEMPHVMVLLDNIERTVIEPLSECKEKLPGLYNFELMEDGGRIKGWQVNGEMAKITLNAIRAIDKKLPFVIGDGNHSLAAAKKCWDSIKEEYNCTTHPSRYALVEVNNVYDEGIEFEPIHRVVFNIDPKKIYGELKKKFACSEGWKITCIATEINEEIFISADNIGELIDNLQNFLEEYIHENGGTIDYIHDTEAVIDFAKEKNTLGLLFPIMDKSDLFKTVSENGVFPKKSFSIGHARDKRYYLECRKIK